MSRIVIKLSIMVSIILLCIYFYGCQYTSEPHQIISNTESIVLAWDPPQTDILVKSYKIYYRKNDTFDWVLLDVITASENPRYVVYHSDLGNGFYDFAVSAVNKHGQDSILHTSRDQNADPLNGWYLFWVRSR